jgi:hypothetical protein
MHDNDDANRARGSFSGVLGGNGSDGGGSRLHTIEFELKLLRRDIDALAEDACELQRGLASISERIELINGRLSGLPSSADFASLRGDLGEIKDAIGKLPTWKGVIWLFVIFGLVASLQSLPQTIETISRAIRSDVASSPPTVGSQNVPTPLPQR